MNLALKDIEFNLSRFILTTLGIGLLVMGVIGMNGLYRGIVADGMLILDEIGADLWIVQSNTVGPFAEASEVPQDLDLRAAAVPGVAEARRFLSLTRQVPWQGALKRMTVLGLAFPDDTGNWLPLVAGRPLGSNHDEAIADTQLGFALGEVIPIGNEFYRVVGLTRGMVDGNGDGYFFVTIPDAGQIRSWRSSETTLLARAGRQERTEDTDLGRSQPTLAEQAGGPSSAIPVLEGPAVAAILVRLAPGADPAAVTRTILGWGDVAVVSKDQQKDLLVYQRLDKMRRQILMFTILLLLITGVVVSLILYTMTLEKLHQIAMLKLIGARNRVIVAMIGQQALAMGVFGFGVAVALGQVIFPLFPRRVVLLWSDMIAIGGILIFICVLGSLFGIVRALKVDAKAVLG